MSEVRYAVYCRGCGHIEDKAWEPATGEAHSKRTDRPLSAQGHVPIYCQKCGQRSWEKPATKEHVDAFDAKLRREVRAAELTRAESFDGIFKIPPEVQTKDALVRRALSNLLGALEGDTLKAAQANVIQVARSGLQADLLGWIDYYDRAVQKAIAAKGSKAAA